MAFVMQQIWSHRSAGIDEQGIRTYTDSYRIISDDPDDGPGEARDQAAFIIGDTYDSGNDQDEYATIRNISATQTDWLFDISVFEINIDYSTQQAPPDQQNKDNPEDTATQISGGTMVVREAYDCDVDGNTARNTAGVSFNPKPERDRSFSTMTVVRNEINFDRTNVIRNYAEHYNSDTFDGHDPGTALLKELHWERVFTAAVPYYRVSYTIVFKDDYDSNGLAIGWRRQRFLSQGTQQLVGSKLVPCIDGEGQVALVDQLLDVNGVQLSIPVAHGDEVYVTLKPYYPATFADLDLLANLP